MDVLLDSKGQPVGTDGSDDVSGINQVLPVEAPRGKRGGDAREHGRERKTGVLARDGARAAVLESEQIAGTLLASARHELRSPLQAIQGFAELLGSESYGSLSEDQHAFVQHILQGSLELGSVLEACLELLQLELSGPELDLVLGELRPVVSDALEHASESSGTSLQLRYGNGIESTRVRAEPTSLRRAFHSLLTGMATGVSKSFRVDIAAEGVHARLTLRASPRSNGLLLSIDEFARRRSATRSLIWLRLAAQLLALQEGSLFVSEQLDCAEVRLQLSSSH